MICLVITRDRLSHTRVCVAALERHDLDIRIVDHGSTWPPMLDWLATSPHPVHRRGNLPPRALWDWDQLPTEPYLVTDPDVLLDCPADWIETLRAELAEHDVAKVGLGLRLDDLPDTALAAKARAWEAPFWSSRLCPRAYSAPVDTTLALYRPGPVFTLGPAARLAAPYLARHLPWYGESDQAEAEHYRRHLLPGSSHWAGGGW